jgi:soluble lytic murein transglycosylase-like protein
MIPATCYKLPARMFERPQSPPAAETVFLSLIPSVVLAGWAFFLPATWVMPRVEEWIQPAPARIWSALQGVQVLKTPKEIETFIRTSAQKYGLPEIKVVRIAWRESKFIPTARSRTGRYVGIYQFDLPTWRNTPEGRAGRRREDPAANINAAHWQMKRYGFKAWGG